MKGRILVLLAACVLVLASCSVSRIAVSSPDIKRLELNITMDDLEYLGESEISVEYRRYLGFIRVVDMVNGKEKDKNETKVLTVSSNAFASGCFSGALGKAAYKLADEFPTADYYRVSSKQKQGTRLFLGGHYTVKAKVKAYKLK